MTRGRAEELETMITEAERRLDRRLDELAREVEHARGEARGATKLALDLARAGLSSMLDVYRSAVAEARSVGKEERPT